MSTLRYLSYKENGICVTCGQRKAMPDKVQCEKCNRQSKVKAEHRRMNIKEAAMNIRVTDDATFKVKVSTNNLPPCALCGRRIESSTKYVQGMYKVEKGYYLQAYHDVCGLLQMKTNGKLYFKDGKQFTRWATDMSCSECDKRLCCDKQRLDCFKCVNKLKDMDSNELLKTTQDVVGETEEQDGSTEYWLETDPSDSGEKWYKSRYHVTCPMCGNSQSKPTKFCGECGIRLMLRNNSEKPRIELCMSCGFEPVDFENPNKGLCVYCARSERASTRTRHNANQQKYYEKTGRAYRESLIAQGICPQCRKGKLENGAHMCEDCRAKARAIERSKAPARFCFGCGTKLMGREHVCHECKEKGVRLTTCSVCGKFMLRDAGRICTICKTKEARNNAL